ncbi:MAG TPA: hypothetical protein PKA64_21735 [Myxococcota bacterium]|nr:hypothetical protein [Myxococcota bacterium]
MRACWAAVLTIGCGAPEVDIGGRVLAERGSASGLAGASIDLRDGEFGSYATAVADDEGWFAVQAPRLRKIHLLITSPDTVPIVFPGTSGQSDFIVPEGQLWGFSEAQRDAWRTDFSGCPAGEGGGDVLGVVRLLNPSADPLVDADNPVEINGFAFIEDEAGVRRDACYLGADGAWDPDATVVGESGRFFLPGVGRGPLRLVFGRRLTDDSTMITEEEVFVPDDGVVAVIPALVTL